MVIHASGANVITSTQNSFNNQTKSHGIKEAVVRWNSVLNKNTNQKSKCCILNHLMDRCWFVLLYGVVLASSDCERNRVVWWWEGKRRRERYNRYLRKSDWNQRNRCCLIDRDKHRRNCSSKCLGHQWLASATSSTVNFNVNKILMSQ